MQDAYIVAYGRSPIGKGRASGAYYYEKPEDIAAQVLNGTLDRVGGSFTNDMIEDVIVGCSIPENLQGSNIGRRIALRAGLGEHVPGQTVTRFCSSGLQTIADASTSIMAEQADVIVAGGLEFLSTTPPDSVEMNNNLYLEEEGPPVSTAMGITAENLAEKYDVPQSDQNEFAVNSHKKAAFAQETGRFEDEIIPVEINDVVYESGEPQTSQKLFSEDQGIRPDTNTETISKLPKVFKKSGTVTAATSSQVSDGTGFVVVMSGRKIKELGVKPIARFVGHKVVGVHPDYMGIGPVEAIPKVLDQAGLTIDDMDIIELNEAFAAQALAVIKELDLDMDKINPNGGAIALGHPNGGTGTILTARLLAEMKKRKDTRYGMVTMCIGGGMGAAGIFEFVGDREN